MRQILMQDPNARILACAPSNSAADLLADRLKQQGTPASEMFRLNAPTRLVGTLSKTLLDCSRKVGETFVVPPIEELLRSCLPSVNRSGQRSDHSRRIQELWNFA